MASFCRFVLPKTANIFKKKCNSRLWSLTTLNASTVSREEISTHITDRASLIDALDGKKARIPLPKDYGTLAPAVSISKDARELIASLISSRLAFADLIVSTNSEKSRALIVYTVLAEILRFGYGDLVKHQEFLALSEPEIQLAILHEEETEGKEMHKFDLKKNDNINDEMLGKLQLNYGEKMNGEVFSGETDFIIYESNSKEEEFPIPYKVDTEKRLRFLVTIKDDITKTENLEGGHYQIIAQLITAVNLNKNGISVWGALTDGYNWYFYKITKNNMKPIKTYSNVQYSVEKSHKVTLFDQGMLQGEKQVTALNFFFSAIFPDVKTIISKENILKSDILCGKKIEPKKKHFELSFYTLEELNEKVTTLQEKLETLEKKSKRH